MVAPGKFDVRVDISLLASDFDSDCFLIVDDVVASGQTATTIAEGFQKLKPGVRCFMASWLFAKPTRKQNKKSASGLDGFEKTFCALALKGNYVSRPPINSLSCFLRKDQKGQDIKSAYFQKYVFDPEGFQEQLEKIRRFL